MNSGHSSTKLNDMLVEFTDYVNDFYGDVDDVLYPMNHMKTGKRVSKVDILGAIYDYLHEITARNDEHFTWGDGDSLDRESCLLYTSPSPRDQLTSRMPSSA